MYEQGSKKNPHEVDGGKATAAAERRNADRHTFTASAEVVELSSGARFSTRTTDLGPGGCFVDTMLPFPVGAKVRVSVRKDQTNLETGGVVVYSQTGLGMGIAFDTMEPRQREALHNWLTELTGVRSTYAPEPRSRELESGSSAQESPASPAVTRLVRLLITKGILTEAEGSSVLYDPVL
ncbi:MAG TPA: PilZ domain-containing protein [Candidatus Acidoferrales bacterium]|nr:PilZ domain-containing protein [Candidatus Acidoferrales bacterium]